MSKLDEIYNTLILLEEEGGGVSANDISRHIGLDRANASRYLNLLVREGRLTKSEGRPVLYRSAVRLKEDPYDFTTEKNLDKIAAAQKSLRIPIQQAKAAILYPPRGLHTMILGETGVGKSMFAELMYGFAKESGIISKDAPMVCFNCADYAENPQLVMAQIFGVKKGAYTGADKDKIGLLKKADGGILFLDEVHRLSPQGQEMLFTFIDTGCFRPLGETDKTVKADVQLIAATTENPQSFLLNTFSRRIPMIITLPPLREKSLSERYYLVEYFIKKESERLGRSIYVSKSSLISFLLYECTNNIGQLGSDIQLACAKAFVNYKSKKEDYLLITQQDIPQHVKKGLMRINECREELDSLLNSKGEILRFSYKEDCVPNITSEFTVEEDFYDVIEKKLENLKSMGLEEEEINQIINIDIESHFHKYLGKLKDRVRRQEIVNLIDLEVYEVGEDMLKLAEKRLSRSFDNKLFIALALHLQSFVERIRRGVKIYNPRLNTIRAECYNEFIVAMEAVKLLDHRLQIQTPLDEIGYLTLFFAANPMNSVAEETATVGIVVIMHGNSTASSMVEVANALVGVDHALAIDMPLSMKPQEIYEITKKLIIKIHQGKGVILMVDMGSLTNFGDMIYEETGIIVRTIDMVCTPMVIDACRKAVLGRDIGEILQSFKGPQQANNRVLRKKALKNKNIIITACFTGQGASERLKRIIGDRLSNSSNIEVIPLDIIERRKFMATIDQLRSKHNILAIVGTVEVHLDNILFISAEEIITGEGLDKIEMIAAEEENFIKIGEALQNHLDAIDAEELVEDIRLVINRIQLALKLEIKAEVKIGIILHMCFMTERLKKGEKTALFDNLQSYKDQYNREMLLIRDCLRPMEDSYGIIVGEHEIAYLCKMFFLNDVKVNSV